MGFEHWIIISSKCELCGNQFQLIKGSYHQSSLHWLDQDRTHPNAGDLCIRNEYWYWMGTKISFQIKFTYSLFTKYSLVEMQWPSEVYLINILVIFSMMFRLFILYDQIRDISYYLYRYLHCCLNLLVIELNSPLQNHEFHDRFDHGPTSTGSMSRN